MIKIKIAIIIFILISFFPFLYNKLNFPKIQAQTIIKYIFEWSEGKMFLDFYWNEQSRAVYDGTTCMYNPVNWPQSQLAAERVYALAARQVTRDLWKMTDWINANGKTGQVWISEAETNCPNGHTDYPPHTHLSYWNSWTALTNTHLYPDINGKITGAHVIPYNASGCLQHNGTVWDPIAGEWWDTDDESCAPVWQQRYTLSGDLELRRSSTSAVYTIKEKSLNGNLASVDILSGTNLLYSLDITEYDPLSYKMTALISDYTQNLLTTEKWTGFNPTNRTITTSILVAVSPTQMLTPSPTPNLTIFPTPTPTITTASAIAFISDYGTDTKDELAVANMVKGWNPDYIVTSGDNFMKWNISATGNAGYDLAVGKYYCNFMAGLPAGLVNCPGGGSGSNRFFPVLGNHDYTDGGTSGNLPVTYLSYFTLPGAGISSTNTSGNERYYDIVKGNTHLFFLNSNDGTPDPDGNTSTSVQAVWLKNQLAKAAEPWKIVVFHHPPYSSDTTHGSSVWMQWPFDVWGADAVISGHTHHYERINVNGVLYLDNASGGDSFYYCGATRVAGSQVCVDGYFGAIKAAITGNSLNFAFYSSDGVKRDDYTLTKNLVAPTPAISPLNIIKNYNSSNLLYDLNSDSKINAIDFSLSVLTGINPGPSITPASTPTPSSNLNTYCPYYQPLKPSPITCTHYVSPQGSDNNDGKSLNSSWKTISKAASLLISGQTVCILNGIYNERVLPVNSGNAGNFITYAAYPGHAPVLDGTGITVGNYQGLFDISSKSYLRVSGLTVKNSAFAGIFSGGGSSNLIIDNNLTIMNYSSGLAVWGPSDHIYLENNNIQNSNMGPSHEALDIAGAVQYFIVSGNEVHNEDIQGKEGIDIKQGPSYGCVFNNNVHDMKSAAIYTDGYDADTHDIDIFNNRVHDNMNINSTGIVLASEHMPNSSTMLHDVKVYNNLVFNIYNCGIRAFNMVDNWPTHPIGNVMIINNTVAASGCGIDFANTQAVGFVIIRNNLAPGINIVSSSATVSNDHNFTGDPLYVNPSTADFHLSAASSAIDSGASLNAPSFDYDYHTRPKGAGFDIGCFEY